MPPKLVISRHHGYNHPRPVIGVVKRWDSGFSCERVVPFADIGADEPGRRGCRRLIGDHRKSKRHAKKQRLTQKSDIVLAHATAVLG